VESALAAARTGTARGSEQRGREREQSDEREEGKPEATSHESPPLWAATLTRTESKQANGPLEAGPFAFDDALLPAGRATAVGICDERGREREQSDREHDERAVQ
jgi:hypothetical protein